MKFLYAMAAICALSGGIAAAQSQCVMEATPAQAPAGFGVQDSGLNAAGYYPFDLATSPSANWGIVAYSNPANEAYLNPFTETVSGGVQTYATTSSSTAAQGMAVTLAKNLATNVQTQTLTQSGVTTGSGCTSNPEFDLFIDANLIPPGDPTYPSGYIAGLQKPTLDKVTGLMISGTVNMVSQVSSTGTSASPCVINQSAMIYSLVFNNATSGQTLFYQLDMNYFCYPGSNANFNAFCASTILQENFFETGAGGIWGIDDPITSYTNDATGSAYSLVQTTGAVDIEINFLPRVAALIQAGGNSLDTNLSHWTFGSFYYGQHTWGSAVMTSTWASQNFSPTLIYHK